MRARRFHLQLTPPLWGSFSISAFKAKSRLGWCCVALRPAPPPEEIPPPLTPHSYERKKKTFSSPALCRILFPRRWDSRWRLRGERGRVRKRKIWREIFAFPRAPLLIFLPSLFLFVLQFEPNPCMLTCHTKSALLKRPHK